MVSPRRSPRLKGPSPKPELPRRPKPPKRVKDVAEDSVRQANFKLELAAWEAEKVEHAKRMKIRKATATASWKAANKSVGKDAAPSTCHLAHLACTSLTPFFAPVCAGAQIRTRGGPLNRPGLNAGLSCRRFYGFQHPDPCVPTRSWPAAGGLHRVEPSRSVHGTAEPQTAFGPSRVYYRRPFVFA